MFDSVGWGEVLVLLVAALFILGPDRLPKAAAWLGQSMRKVRHYANGARDQMRSEFGSEFDEWRKPLQDLRSLRDLNPRRAITQHLFDGYDPVEDLRSFDVRDDLSLRGTGDPDTSFTRGADGATAGTPTTNGAPHPPSPTARPLDPGERPPFDPDAT
jgi:sec-independent protein translocase protein TatB